MNTGPAACADTPGFLLLVAAPSGAGKTTLVRQLVDADPGLTLSVSHTTRHRRGSERDGVEYHFVADGAFDAMIERGEFLEYAEVFGRHYGTSARWVEEQLRAGLDVVLEIDWQGAEQVRRANVAVVSVFILPPSLDALLERLRQRGEDTDSDIARRIREAKVELAQAGAFDYLIVNDELPAALADLRAVVCAERLRQVRQRQREAGRIAALLDDSQGPL